MRQFSVSHQKTSLPIWERGLKLEADSVVANKTSSLPIWERGLKLTGNTVKSLLYCVAPYMGAWIETIKSL